MILTLPHQFCQWKEKNKKTYHFSIKFTNTPLLEILVYKNYCGPYIILMSSIIQ
jgi:hypothetical protein